MIDKKKDQTREGNEVKTFTVPFPLIENQENIRIITNSPTNSSKEQIINQAFKFHSEGNISEAAKYYQYFIDQGFHDPMVFSNYGVILKQTNQIDKAIKIYNKSIKLFPTNPDAHYNLGIILASIGKLQEAEYSYRKAIRLNPNKAEAHNNLGNLLKILGKLQEAEISTRKAIELKPDFAEAHSNLGSILNDLGKSKEAEISHREAIALRPDFAEAYSNLGAILRYQGKLNEAEISINKAIEFKPDFDDAYFNLSSIELIKGNYKSGLKYYELRFKKKDPVIPHANPKIKNICSTKLQKGEKLLIVSEQGLGDTIQYMRYVPHMRNMGFEISFCAQLELHLLIKASGIDNNPLTPMQANKVSEGKWIPLLSLARYLNINPTNPIITEPYIHPKVKLIKKWEKILSREERPIIGINWQGNPKMENIYKGRSIPLEIFSLLLGQNDVKMLSLQKGFGSEQLENCTFKTKFVSCQSEIDSIWDFHENAAIIENCDLIITNDTAIAHLAGGMGKKVWLLIPRIAFWTWGLESKSTFWYPSMRLFRQKERDNWLELMQRVSNELKAEMDLNV